MQIRPAQARDLQACIALDHSYTTDHVWQMEARQRSDVLGVTFRVARLPREVQVSYPRRGEELLVGWRRRDGFLVAVEQERICGYVGLIALEEQKTAWVGDLIVDRAWRRRGAGTAMLRAAAWWGRENDLGRMVIEVQTKNYPAIRFCQSRGLSFWGYNDHYWPNQDIALFFGQSLR